MTGFFAGKRYWIIGASAGIGAALASELHRRGASLILSARDGRALQALAQGCGNATVLPLDLGQRETLVRAVASLAGTPVDGVICTAALYDPARVADLDAARSE